MKNLEIRVYSILHPSGLVFLAGILASTATNLLTSMVGLSEDPGKSFRITGSVGLFIASFMLFAAGSTLADFRRRWAQLMYEPTEVLGLLREEGRLQKIRLCFAVFVLSMSFFLGLVAR